MNKMNGIKCLIQVLESLGDCDCDDVVEGCITLNQGTHEVVVKTEVSPSEVFLSVRSIGTPVCNGDVDMVGYSVLPDGFILYADIKSTGAEVCYFVEE
jgi:hypothetical protein